LMLIELQRGDLHANVSPIGAELPSLSLRFVDGGLSARLLRGTRLRKAAFNRRSHRRRSKVDEQHGKGAADKIKGAVKDAVGGATGDNKMQAEGKLDKAKGSARNMVGDAKDAVKDSNRK
jgi:uncharacterized protein YjbJ (UPF0337 family)